MITTYYKTLKGKEFAKKDKPCRGSFLAIEGANEKDMEKVVELTGLDWADVRDALDEHEIPRVERQEGKVILFVRSPSRAKVGLYTELLTMIVTKEYFVAVAMGKSEIVGEVIEGKADFGTAQKSKLLLRLLLRVSHKFTREIKRVTDTVARQKKEFMNVESSDIVQLARNEEILNQYISALLPMRNALDAMLSRGYVKLYEDDNDLLQDVLIGLNQSVDVGTVNIKSIRNLRDAYQTIFTNDLNKTIKLLTSVTIILTIPTIVASIYGMNVVLPLARSSGAFLYVMAATVGLMVVGLLVFRMKKWF